MICLLKPNTYSSYMKKVNVDSTSWNRLIANPMVLDDKANCPLMIWGKMADMVEIDEDSGMPRCTGANIEKIYALQVDFDSGMTIKTFRRDYARYSYQLYTSYNYGFKPSDRFRVLFPLKEPIYISHLVPPVKQILKDFAPEADVSCWDRGHWQCLPCVRSKDAPYEFEQHDGVRLSFALDDFAKLASEYSEVADARRSFAEADRNPNDSHEGALRSVQKVFDETTEGQRDIVVYRKLNWLKNIGCTYNEVISLNPPAGFDAEYAAKVKRLFL